jgi:hypothetical protein
MSKVTAHISPKDAPRRVAHLLAIVVLVLATSGMRSTENEPSSHNVAENEQEELEGRAPTVVELEPGVEAVFSRDSYARGEEATLRVAAGGTAATSIRILRVGPESVATRQNDVMNGVPVTHPRIMRTSAASGAGAGVSISVGNWPSGLYFARLTETTGLVGFAPFVVRPKRLGGHRVAVVLPTNTWQAYNLRDVDDDGVGDSWYANWNVKQVETTRAFLSRGVPPHFRAYDLPFIRWLAHTGRRADFLSDLDLERVGSGARLADAYDLVIFPGHHEYVTQREYDIVERYRDLGGNLMFLSANNFFWHTRRHGSTIERTAQWRELGRPEARLLGVQYRANDRGTHRGPFIVRATRAGRWIFAGTCLGPGSTFGSFGIEIDKTTADSPPGTEVVAEIPDLLGPGRTAQMTYYETKAGAKVFAAGAFTLAGAADTDPVPRILENLWDRLVRP